MPMLCLAGTFRIVSTESDGDSIRFYPDDPAVWARVPGPNAVRTNAGGGAQLRLDGIDALETHYSPRGGGPLHQPIDLAHQARDELVRWLGFRGIERTGETVTAATPEELPGYLLTRGADVYGRCVALIGRGDAPAASGTQAMVRVADLRRTANHRMIATGLAYPTFYLKLYADLRAELAKQSRQARDAKKGVWVGDRTQKGVDVESLAMLTDDAVLLPKLFRRLVDYLAINDRDVSLDGFPTYLEQRQDPVFILSTGAYTGFDFVVDVRGQVVRLTTDPEDLVFQEA
ncbi:MAG: nuclease [Solirubrobacteraceae bacterium]